MLNKREIKTIMEESMLPMEKVWVGFGSALCMHGIKESTKDIDAQCQQDLFEELIERGYEVKKAPMGGRMIEFNEYLDLFENTGEPERTLFIEGVQVDSLEKIIEWKTARGREKDLKDIEIIKSYLKETI